MRRRNFAGLAVLMALAAVASWAADVTGNWTGQMAMADGNEFVVSFTFKQEGTTLTGTVQGPQGDPIAISDGKVEGNKLSFVVKVEFNGGMKFVHEGTINGDEIKLTTKSDNPDFPGGSMVLKRAK